MKNGESNVLRYFTFIYDNYKTDCLKIKVLNDERYYGR